ncbi:MAG: hypothetical protein JO080_10140 [Mucilaginibacter sp.]|nr:hypothetical protein [Mucilaginibacter sp.]
MNHVFENAIIVAVLLAVILIPVTIVVINSSKSKKKRINSELMQAEKDLKANFNHIDHIYSSVIAMDEEKKIIIQMNLEDYGRQLIDLKNVTSCSVEEKKQGNATLLLQLALRLNNQRTPHYIVLYKQYIDKESHLKKLFKTATQWEIMINRAIAVPV